jgi:osmoprotectant transport system permease protein
VLISPKRAGDRRLVEALKPLIGAIPVAEMQAANYSVDRDDGKLTPAQAARAMEGRISSR